MKATNYADYKNGRLKNPDFKKAYDESENDFLLAQEVIQFRKEKHLTQKQLAEVIGTSQPAIARLESGSYKKLSLEFIRRVADALDAVPEIHLKKKVHS
ncbi:MAG: helix-turn-helix transcriptional regulator [Spirochaetaceae bacterium]|jgi:DNA-binding XRE family transcriptional regulator|nr:helix-turn-helix transcriptional regulator [Spirochaetaceae bacterium]